MSKKILFLITVFSFFIRFIYSSTYPPLLWDEASLGYNAYSILKTGRDEYGQILPYIFKSFGDYKPGFYVYLAVPFVAFLGLNPVSVRLPSIILGSLIPLLFYLILKSFGPKSEKIAIFASIMIAINPWNIHYSRGAWETNVLLFELILACYLYINKKYLLSATIFGLTLYTYQGGKIMSPLLILILFILENKFVFTKNNLFKFVLPLFIFSIPIIYGLLFQSDSNRLQVFGLWSYHRPNLDTQQIISESDLQNFNIFHNNYIFISRNFLTRYFNHFSPKFLLTTGDWQIGRQSAPYIGMLLFPTFFLYIYGFFTALSQKLSKATLFFLLWLIISPLPAALTIDIIQPVRTLSMTIPLIYFASVGLSQILNHLKLHVSAILRITGYLLLIAAYSISFIYYNDLYFNHMVKIKPDHWLYGYQPAMEYTMAHMANKQVTFTDFYGQPYIYYLFESKYPPQKYQSQSKLESNGLDTGKVKNIDNISFGTPDYSRQKNLKNQLLIFSYDEVLRQGIDFKSLIPISPINGHSSFYAYETN